MTEFLTLEDVAALLRVSKPVARKVTPSPYVGVALMFPRGVVYCIQSCGPAGPCKIGRTTRLYSRLKALRSASAFELKVLVLEHGGSTREAALHQRFADQRIHGEWFRFAGLVREFVESSRDERWSAL